MLHYLYNTSPTLGQQRDEPAGAQPHRCDDAKNLSLLMVGTAGSVPHPLMALGSSHEHCVTDTAQKNFRES